MLAPLNVTHYTIATLDPEEPVVLTETGKQRLRAALESLVQSESIQKTTLAEIGRYVSSQGYAFDDGTIGRILRARNTDPASIADFFTALGLTLTESDYQFPVHGSTELPDRTNSQTSKPKSSTNIPLKRPAPAERKVSDWVIQQYLTPWKTASNGLQYRIAKMHHEFQERFDRGKCYELELLSTDERKRIESRLRRHDRTLSTLAKAPGIPQNRTVLETYGRWWIIDEWVQGETLTAVLKKGSLSMGMIPSFARSLITIIQAMHAADVILRDLSPDTITIREEDGQPFITDFEMAKLFSRRSTVSSGDWERSPFLAPEIVEGEETPNPQVDFYSWAMLVVATGTGELKPTPELAAKWSSSAQLPRPVGKILNSCINPSWRRRPPSAGDILQEVSRW